MADIQKTCFVIAPIGSVGSEIRRRSDCCLEYIVKPAFKQLGFAEPERIDQSDEAGLITPKIIKKIYEADWCVADLSGQNANVFYELGIRHSFQKPVLHLADDVRSIPFDNSHQNTIEYVHDDPRSHREAIDRIVKQVSGFNEESEPFSSPVSSALGLLKLDESGDERDELLVALHEKVASLERSVLSERANQGVVNALMSSQTVDSLAPSIGLRGPKLATAEAVRELEQRQRDALLRTNHLIDQRKT